MHSYGVFETLGKSPKSDLAVNPSHNAHQTL